MFRTIMPFIFQYIKLSKPTSWASRTDLVTWQDHQVQSFLQKVLPQSPFYRKYYEHLSIEEWQSFPTINKSIMMDHFDTLNTIGIKKKEAFKLALQAEQTRNFTPMIKRTTIGLSSGTSGNRGLFLVSEKERMMWAGSILAKVLPRSIFGKHRIAFFLRANSNLYNSVAHGRITFRFFDLLTPLIQNLKELNHFQPTSLIAPPSMLRFIAEAQLAGSIQLQPEKVISVAEVLDPLDERVIRRAFGTIVHQVYQCTEGFIATTCAHGTLHINEDLLVVQKNFLDKRLRKFTPIITDFSRYTQPIIRYDLNDILTERADPCPCGSLHLAIEQIEGRQDDLLYFKGLDTDTPIPVFPDFIRRALITADEQITAYQVIQHRLGHIEIHIQSSNPDPVKLQQKIQINIDALCQSIKVESPIIAWEAYQHPPSIHKLRRIKRMYA
ncbi:F390 synthetase-related protein [Polycladospora coralii]|nr:F390 synthetase-related protein [Polycladospora coralii]